MGKQTNFRPISAIQFCQLDDQPHAALSAANSPGYKGQKRAPPPLCAPPRLIRKIRLWQAFFGWAKDTMPWAGMRFGQHRDRRHARKRADRLHADLCQQDRVFLPFFTGNLIAICSHKRVLRQNPRPSGSGFARKALRASLPFLISISIFSAKSISSAEYCRFFRQISRSLSLIGLILHQH